MAFAMLSVDDHDWGNWGDQWQDADKQLNRQNFKILNPPSIAKVLQTLRTAVTRAGTSGTLILNVGHGHLLFTCQPGTVCVPPTSFEGSVDLAPNNLITVGGQNSGPPAVFVSVFYDVPRFSSTENEPSDKERVTDKVWGKQLQDAARDRLRRWAIYKQYADTIKNGHLYKVIILSCRIGQRSGFICKIASDFGTIVEAYTLWTAEGDMSALPASVTRGVSSTLKKIVFLTTDRDHPSRDYPTTTQAAIDAATQVPLPTETNSFRCGLPITPP